MSLFDDRSGSIFVSRNASVQPNPANPKSILTPLSSAQLSSELAKKCECRKEIKERTSLTFVSLASSTVSIAIKWLEMKGSWGCSWYTFRFFLGWHGRLSHSKRWVDSFIFLTASLLMKYAFGVETACRLIGYRTWVSENTIPTPYDDRSLVCTKGYRGKKSGRIPFLRLDSYSAKTCFPLSLSSTICQVRGITTVHSKTGRRV